MDMFDDDDIFEISDEEIHGELSSSCNPIDDYLIKQLNDVRDSIEQIKNDTLHVEKTTEKILTGLYKQCTLIDDESSDSDGDWYDKNGEPIVKRNKHKHTIYNSLLVVKDIWQRVIDDKWIIGVELQNNSDRILQAPRLYLMIKDQDEFIGVTSLWEMNENLLWNKIENINPDCENIVTTVALNLPKFYNTTLITAYGTIVYYLDDKELQTPINTIKLSNLQAIDKLLSPRYATNLNASILAIKSVAIEKVITISLKREPERGVKLINFLTNNEFIEVTPDVHMSKNPETLRYCIFEILSLTDNWIKLRISTRSMTQLNIILHMVGNEFPDLAETVREDKIIDGVIAFENELQLKLNCDEPTRLINSRILTDLLVP